ncbi:MAG: hypothetical protein JW915_24700 [Chitinispirillaceae bacterium]|nr:hypothetical protein [Chitinispirillaceae bacterium]
MKKFLNVLLFTVALTTISLAQDFQTYDYLFDQYIQDMITPDPVMEYLFYNPDFYLQDMILERNYPWLCSSYSTTILKPTI